MTFYPNERIGIFIDGANLYSTAKSLDYDIDYNRLQDFFRQKGILVRAYYYTAILENDDYSPIQPLIDFLDYNGYQIVTKPAKEQTDDRGRRKIKGNMDIEMAVDMIEMAEHLDHLVLFTGDGDFCRAVDAVQRRGARVTVVSTQKSKPSMLADELRRKADTVMELADMDKLIGRDPNGQRYNKYTADTSRSDDDTDSEPA